MVKISYSRVVSLGRWLLPRPQSHAATSLRVRTRMEVSKRDSLDRHGFVLFGRNHMKQNGGASTIIGRTILDRFRRSQRGVAALEFALVAPFLILLLLAGFELTRYVTSIRKLTNMANGIAEMVAQNTTGSINAEDIQFYLNSVTVDFPQILNEASVQGVAYPWLIQITISSIYFTPTVAGCTSNCTYDAYPAFSGGGNQRPCFVKLTPVADTAAPTSATLPRDAYGPGSIIVVDVTYNYKPRIATKIFGVMPIHRSFYIQPRYVPLVKYDFTAGWWAQACV